MRLAGIVAASLVLLAPSLGAAAPVYDSGGAGEPQRLLVRAHRSAYHGRYTEALALVDQALAMAPNYGDAVDTRTRLFASMGRFQDADAEYKRLKAMRPDDMAVGMFAARLALYEGRGKDAADDVKQALTLPLFSARHAPGPTSAYEGGGAEQRAVTGHMESHADMYLSVALQLQHQDDASLAYFDRMLKLEAVHPEYILAQYCWVASVAGLAESGEAACEQAIAENSHDIGQYDSLGFARLKLRHWPQAIEAYNHALADRGDLSTSLYGRGIARRMSGDTAGGDADIAAAKAQEPDIVNIMARLGVKPV